MNRNIEIKLDNDFVFYVSENILINWNFIKLLRAMNKSFEYAYDFWCYLLGDKADDLEIMLAEKLQRELTFEDIKECIVKIIAEIQKNENVKKF